MKKLSFLFSAFLVITLSQKIFPQSGWQQINSPEIQDNLKNIQLFSADEVFLSADSNIIKTTNGGQNWTKQFTGLLMNQIMFADYNTGYSVNTGKIYKTTNHGVTWAQLPFSPAIPSPLIIKKLCVKNADELTVEYKWTFTFVPPGPPYIVIFTYYDVISLSSNGGQTWGQAVSTAGSSGSGAGTTNRYIQNYLYAGTAGYAMHNENFTYNGVTTNTCYIFKSTDGFRTWNQVYSFPNMNGKNIFFADENTGYASVYLPAGTSPFAGFYKTTNAGTNWTKISDFIPDKFLFTNDYTAYSTGYGSSDGGYNWVYQFTPQGSYDIKFANNLTGYILGVGSIIYKTTNGGGLTIEVNSNSSIVPDKFILYQNYPNPFNPTTIINYQLTINSFVNLKVYNLQGKEVQTLVNKKQSVGNYSIEFNGSNLPSGIYFYTLQTENFSDTKKMILIK